MTISAGAGLAPGGQATNAAVPPPAGPMWPRAVSGRAPVDALLLPAAAGELAALGGAACASEPSITARTRTEIMRYTFSPPWRVRPGGRGAELNSGHASRPGSMGKVFTGRSTVRRGGA